MKLGDLIYDSHFEEHGLVVKVEKPSWNENWCTVLYADGQVVEGIRAHESTIEVVNESR
tara:strand:- start:1086 stop:1262 length:177 start_codon:yes stop_codon:yes gene_type:complete